MALNANFAQRAAGHAAQTPWGPSPMAGVEQRMGDELARATTIVRYAPGSRFSPHVHDRREEYPVREDVFQDEHGDFPVGTFVRNPPGSHHAPRADTGATILVKPWQFDPADRQHVVIDSHDRQPVATACNDVDEIPLYQDTQERVRIELWQPGARGRLADHKGMELFVVAGGFVETGEQFSRHDWLRLPVGHVTEAVADADGARLWVKSGHLARPPRAPQR